MEKAAVCRPPTAESSDGDLPGIRDTSPYTQVIVTREGESVDVPEIDIAELVRRREAGAEVIDVREPDEYREGHVPGISLIPLGDLAERTDEVPTDREVLIICRSGGRSARAAQYLRGLGVDAVNIAGGTDGWIAAGHRVVTGDEPGL